MNFVRARSDLLDLLRSDRTGLLSLSVLVGLGAGLGAVAFRYLIQGVTPHLVEPDGPVADALRQLNGGADAVAVANADGALVGWLRHQDLLAALS